MTTPTTMTIALISDVFFENRPAERLRARLEEARSRGAELAVLPELPLNPWSPATRQAREDDAEGPGGPRSLMQAEAAREVGIGLVGGVILRDPQTGDRRNTAVVFDSRGELIALYAKNHLPEEPGFWETSHYVPGAHAPSRIDGFTMPLGVQICSDINRPEGSHLLGAQGVEAILAPRATEIATYGRWRPVFIANALTSTAYVLSVNRPSPEAGVLIGGPSIAVAPNGTIVLETTEAVGVVTLDRAIVEAARPAYPGYLPVRAAQYAEAWSRIADDQSLPAMPIDSFFPASRR